MKRVISALLVCTALILAVANFGCQQSEPKGVSITDDMGREVSITGQPERIVSLAPSTTELLFAIGLDDKIVGVTDACDYPAEAKDKPKVGLYYTTNLESILAQNPDLILTDGHDPVGEKLRDIGRPMVVLRPDDVEGVFADIKLLGLVTGKNDEAAQLESDLRSRMKAVTDKVATAETKPTVFYEIDGSTPTNPWTAGPGSFVDILITLSGGENIVKADSEWLQFSLEELVRADPDMIILGDYPFISPEQVQEREVWKNLTAVKNGKVYAISDPSLTNRGGPRIIDGLEEMARFVHPELFQ